jgi:hypothetical protein
VANRSESFQSAFSAFSSSTLRRDIGKLRDKTKISPHRASHGHESYGYVLWVHLMGVHLMAALATTNRLSKKALPIDPFE